MGIVKTMKNLPFRIPAPWPLPQRAVPLLLLALLSCAEAPPLEEEDRKAFRGQLAATEVQVVPAEIRPFEYLIRTTGLVAAVSEAEIRPAAGGVLLEVAIKNGQRVAAGQLLARFDSRERELAVEKAKMQYLERELEFENMLLGFNFDRLGPEAAAKTKENVRVLSGLGNAEIALKEAELALERTLVTAPAAGIVADLELQQGAYLPTGEKLCSVYQPSPLRVQADVLESDLLRLSLGQPADIYPLAAPDRAFKARLSEINPRVSHEQGTVRVWLTLQESAGLVPGMHARAVLRIPYEQNIIVPKTSVVIRSGRAVIFTEEGGLAKWNYVTTGLENGDETEILEGLKAGSRVITGNNLQLDHDAPVRITGNEG